MVSILRFLLCCALLGSYQPSRAAAEAPSAVKHFDLPAQNLASGLIEFALQAQTTLVVDDQLVDGLYSHPVSGRLSVHAALGQILEGTALEFTFQPQTNAYLLHKTTPPPDQAVQTPAPIDEILVVGYLTYPFRYTTVRNSQLQANVIYFDSVRFANVLPQQLISDQQTEDFAELLKFASGVMPGDGLADTNDDIYIRGFQRGAIFLDGLRIGDTTGSKLLPTNIERVEILKGPGTIFFGQAEPGGTLNFISKKPNETNLTSAEISTGTLGKERYSLDINRHFNAFNSRLILSDQRQQSSADLEAIHRQSIAPSFAAKFGEGTHLDLNYIWQYNAHVANTEFTIPATRTTQDTFYQPYPQRDPLFESRFNLVKANLRFALGERWSLNLNGGEIKEKRDGVRPSSDTLTNGDALLKQSVGEDSLIIPLGGRVAVPIGLTQQRDDWTFQVGPIRSLFAQADRETNRQLALLLNGTPSFGGFEHKLSIGLDWRKHDLFKHLTAEVNGFNTDRIWPLDSFNAVLKDISNRLFTADRPLGALDPQASQLINADTGYLITDSITLSDNWIVSIGSRLSKMHGELSYFDTPNSAAPSPSRLPLTEHYRLPSYQNISSQLGAVYKPSEAHSWYLNYSEAVRANYRIDAPESKNAQPETSSQYEIGLKTRLMDDRMLASIGLFRIAKDNISEIIPKNGSLNTLNYFDQSARGLDADITWQINSHWDVMAGVGWLDAITESGKQQGKTPADIAKASASFFTHYRFNAHWSADLGASYLGTRYGSTLGDKFDVLGQKAKLPAYSILDLHLTYHQPLWGLPSELKLSVKNAANERYYTAFVAGVRPNIAEGRSVLGTFRISY